MAKRILIVDDERSLAFFLSENLTQLGPDYQVGIAHSGEEALKRVSAEPFDLVIADLRMPGISGLELIQRLRQISPSTRSILITAYGNEKVAQEALRLGAYGYILKPFRMEKFLTVVQEALQRDMLLAQIFHELRMPLTFVMSYADMLSEEAEGCHREWAQIIQRQTVRMRDALDDLTLLTEWNASRMPGYLQSIDLQDALDSALVLVNPLAMERNQTLEITPLPEPIQLNTDGWLLGALLTAILSCTIKHAPVEGQIHITAHQNGNRKVTLTIEGENGVSPSQDRPMEPTSVSLSVAQRLVEALGGELLIEANGGSGSVSRLILPDGLYSPQQIHQYASI